jgi:hypothetical protein
LNVMLRCRLSSAKIQVSSSSYVFSKTDLKNEAGFDGKRSLFRLPSKPVS